MRYTANPRYEGSLPQVKAAKSPTSGRLLINFYFFGHEARSLTSFAIPWNLLHFSPLQSGRLYAINQKAPHAKLANDLKKSSFHFTSLLDRVTSYKGRFLTKNSSVAFANLYIIRPGGKVEYDPIRTKTIESGTGKHEAIALCSADRGPIFLGQFVRGDK